MGFTQQDNRQYAAGQAQPGNGAHLGSRHNNLTTTADGTPAVPITHTSATGPAPHTAGPHRHDLANKLDPTVDSNLKGTGAAGGTTNTYGSNANSGNTGGLLQGGHPQHHNNQHHNNQRHNDGAGFGAGAGTGAGLGHNNNFTTQGGHGGLGTTGHAHNHGVGGQQTAGPHQSDVLNKLDPTVDSRTGLRK